MRAFSLLAAFTSVAVTFAAPIDLGQVAGTATHLVDSTAGADLTGTVNGVVGKVNGVISTVNGVAAPVVEKVDGLTGGIVHSRDTLADGALSPVVEKVTGVTGTVHQVAGSALGTVHDAIPSEVTDAVDSVVEKVDLSKVTGGLRRSSDAELGNELSNDLLSFANNVHVSGRGLDLKEATDSVSELTHPEVDVPKPDVDVKVVSRCDCTTVPNILNDVTDQLKPILQQITSLDIETCTLSTITTLLTQVKTILSSAASQLSSLNATESSEQLLSSVNGVLSINDVVGLCSTLFKLVFGAITVAIKFAVQQVDSDKEAVLGLCGEVVSSIGQLVQLLISLVGSTGIVSLLLPICTPFIQIISQLGVTQAFTGLGLPDVTSMLPSAL